MKRVICTICLLLIVGTGGCATYWYQPGKTLEQCSQDSLECVYEANKYAYPKGPSALYPLCMTKRGYKSLAKDELPVGIKTKMIQITSTGLFYVTGE